MADQQKIIDANDRSVRQVLDKVKYTIDVFQREYKWQQKQMDQLIMDLTSRFWVNHKKQHERQDVEKYGKYYLGSIVLCLKGGKRSIIDGQQRLTSLTLLLIYLNNLQKSHEAKIKLDDLIYSEKYAKKSFNLQVDDREKCVESLYEKGDFDASTGSESVKNIVDRYHDIEELFPDGLKKEILPFFIDWVIDNVIFVEIVTYSDDDAYTIFETMNDRGLNLTSAEMLKGYLISNLGTNDEKAKLNDLWKEKILSLKAVSKEEDLEFFKTWLRAKYAVTIRQGKRGSENEDFEKIGTRFHSWVRDNKNKLELKSSSDFHKFIETYFDRYVKLYLNIDTAAKKFLKRTESIYYLEKRAFPRTFYFPLLIAPVTVKDDAVTTEKKFALVSKFLEMFVVFRSINHKTLAYSSIRYTMFSLVNEIRDKSVAELTKLLKKKANELKETVSVEGVQTLRLHGQNKRFIHFLLARITSYIEEKCGIPSSFEDYMNPDIKKPFEVEHIWSDKFDEYKDEFEQRDEWDECRNKIGALLLLPRGFNQSYGDLAYERKLPHYFGQNILARSLNTQCYDRNPSFLRFMKESGLPFKAHDKFKKQDIEQRTKLYQKICEQIYDVAIFDKIASQ